MRSSTESQSRGWTLGTSLSESNLDLRKVVRSNITSDLIMAGLHEADAISIAYSKVKFLPKIAL